MKKGSGQKDCAEPFLMHGIEKAAPERDSFDDKMYYSVKEGAEYVRALSSLLSI